MCSYFWGVLICWVPLFGRPPVQCSQSSPFTETWHSEMLLTPLFGLVMLWLPEMRQAIRLKSNIVWEAGRGWEVQKWGPWGRLCGLILD